MRYFQGVVAWIEVYDQALPAALSHTLLCCELAVAQRAVDDVLRTLGSGKVKQPSAAATRRVDTA